MQLFFCLWTIFEKPQKSNAFELKPHKCTECSFAFLNKRGLQEHVNAKHLMVKPFKCDNCSLSFASKTHLRFHIKSVHVESKPEKAPEVSSEDQKMPPTSKHELGKDLLGNGWNNSSNIYL